MQKFSYILFLFFVLNLSTAWGKIKHFDKAAFERHLDSIEQDTAKCRYILDHGECITWAEPDFLPYAFQALEIAKKYNYQYNTLDLLAGSLRLVGRTYHYNGNISEALGYFKSAVVVYRTLKNYKRLKELYNRIANDYFNLKEYDQALLANEKVIYYAKKTDDNYRRIVAIRQIGVNYLRLKQFDSAFVYLNKALNLGLKLNDLKNTAYNYSEMGDFYYYKNNLKKALTYQKKAYSLNLDGEKYILHVKTLINQRLAKDYLTIGKPDSALIFILKALKMDRKPQRLINSSKIAAKIFLKEKKYDLAKKYLDTALMMTKKTKNYYELNNVYKIYERLFADKGDINKVLYYNKIRLDNYDSIYGHILNKQVESIKVRHDIDNLVKMYQLLAKQKKEKENRLTHYKMITYGGAIILFLTLIYIFLLYLYLKKIKRKNEIIFQQKEELQQQKEALQKSLDEIQEMHKQLVQSKKMASLGTLAAGIAHEINNPINFVYSGINSLKRDFEDLKPVIEALNKLNAKADDIKEKIKEIDRLKEKFEFEEAWKAIPAIINDVKLGAVRTAEIVKGLKDFSSGSKDNFKLYDIHKAIDTSLLLLKNKYKNRIEIIKKYDPKLKEIVCKPGKINQAILNILANAVDAIEGKGKIVITTKDKGDQVKISIKDSGMGISQEMIEKIFDPFFTTKEVGKGTGLGLYITYEIVKEHKGEIEVLSEKGSGTEFIIILPKRKLTDL